MTHMLIARLHALDDALAARGFPRISSWWRSTLTRFYESERRQLVLRVGRRGGKSSTLCRVAVLEALFGEHSIPPGDVGIAAFVSVSRDEASQRLRTIRAILDALGVGYRPIEHGVELESRPIAFKTFVATVAGVSGFTCIVAVCDEVAKWRDAETGANPATEVLGSLGPTLATQPHAKKFLASSPVGRVDAHAVTFDQGETSFQSVAYAPTWEAHPAITEQATHDLEPHAPTWAREYAAIPTDGAVNAFAEADTAHLARLPHPDSYALNSGALFIDSSSGRGDAWTWAIAQYIVEPCGESIYLTREVRDAQGTLTMRDMIRYGEDGRPLDNPKYRPPRQVLYLSALGAFEGPFAQTISFSDVVAAVSAVARGWGVTRCFGDQHLAYALEGEFAKNGLRFAESPWTGPSKIEATSTARRLLRERTIAVEPSEEAEKLRRELLLMEERITPNGITIQAKRTAQGHADRASLLLLVAHCESEGAIAGSPLARATGPSTYDPYTHEETY